MDLAGLAKAAAASAVCPSPLPKVILGCLEGMGTHSCHAWIESTLQRLWQLKGRYTFCSAA